MINESKLLDRKILKNGDKFDQSLLWMLVLLVSFGLLMVYSASIAWSSYGHKGAGGVPWAVAEKQAYFIAAAAALSFVLFWIPMRFWRKAASWFLLLNLLALVLVLAVGANINGAKRWLALGPVSFQPSETYKLVVIMYMASFFHRRADVLKQYSKLVWPGLALGAGMGLILVEPDLGATVVAVAVALGLLFLADLPKKWFALAVTLGCLGLMAVVAWGASYRMGRIAAFLNPFRDPEGVGYQLSHSLMAVARGEWFGTGLGGSIDKQLFLTKSEAHTDFIFAIISEEWGFFGMCMMLFCYGWLLWRAFSIGKQARDLELFFSSFVCYGVGMWIGVQSLVHIGVNIGLLPTKGLILPLVSYGGSAMFAMMAAVMLLLRADYENRRKMRGYKVEG